MRIVVAALLAALLLAGNALATEHLGKLDGHVVTDPEGDVELSSLDESRTPPEYDASGMDIVRIDTTREGDELTQTLTFAGPVGDLNVDLRVENHLDPNGDFDVSISYHYTSRNEQTMVNGSGMGSRFPVQVSRTDETISFTYAINEEWETVFRCFTPTASTHAIETPDEFHSLRDTAESAEPVCVGGTGGSGGASTGGDDTPLPGLPLIAGAVALAAVVARRR